ncbi:MAG: DUF167 domain-containing protein [Patescibacteria group bacterium]
MKISVEVHPQARVEKVLEFGAFLKVYTRAPAKDGRANARTQELVADYYGVAFSRVRILRGHTSKQKIFEVT